MDNLNDAFHAVNATNPTCSGDISFLEIKASGIFRTA
jgi:hypothetical protein